MIVVRENAAGHTIVDKTAGITPTVSLATMLMLPNFTSLIAPLYLVLPPMKAVYPYVPLFE